MASLFTILSSDRLTLQGRIWTPQHPDAIICLLHGFGEHSGRYQHVAEAFGQKDLALAAIDLRGHGLSEGKRGHTPSFDLLMQDIEIFLDHVSKNFPGKPLVLYGHSMGGNLAANYLIRKKPQNISAGLLTSPWFTLRFNPPKLKLLAGKVMLHLYPAYSEHNGLDPKDLSTDPAVGDAYMNDPLVIHKISTGMYFAISRAGEWAVEHAYELQTPTLVMHGADDRITSPKSSELFAQHTGSTYKRWNGMYHELHNERDQANVLEYMITWLRGTMT